MYLVKPRVLTRAQTNWNNHGMNMYGGTRVIHHQQYFICTLGGGGECIFKMFGKIWYFVIHTVLGLRKQWWKTRDCLKESRAHTVKS